MSCPACNDTGEARAGCTMGRFAVTALCGTCESEREREWDRLGKATNATVYHTRRGNAARTKRSRSASWRWRALWAAAIQHHDSALDIALAELRRSRLAWQRIENLERGAAPVLRQRSL